MVAEGASEARAERLPPRPSFFKVAKAKWVRKLASDVWAHLKAKARPQSAA